jgi:hypothetical protein
MGACLAADPSCAGMGQRKEKARRVAGPERRPMVRIRPRSGTCRWRQCRHAAFGSMVRCQASLNFSLKRRPVRLPQIAAYSWKSRSQIAR